MAETQMIIYSNHQYPRYELRYVESEKMNVDIVSDACYATLDKRKKMDKDPPDSGYSSGSHEVVNSVKGRESKLIETDLCVICGDKATKYRYSHYGTTSCFSCRAFYRRTLKKSSHELFYCTTGECEVTVETRKKCQYCRFKKCKAVGMTYRDPDNLVKDSDGIVTIPKELFEARQKELKEISSPRKEKENTKMTEMSVKKSTKDWLKTSLYNKIKEKKTLIEAEYNSKYFENISKDFGSTTFNSTLLTETIDEQIVAENETNSETSSIVGSINNIEALKSTVCEADFSTFSYMDVDEHEVNMNLDVQEGDDKILDVNNSAEMKELEERYFVNLGDRISKIPLNPRMKFTSEEKQRVDHLLKLDQSIVISFDDLDHDVAVKVIHEMFDKAFSFLTMDYELIFWGYTFAIKKITWFAQAIDDFSVCEIEDKKCLLLQNLDPMFNIKSAMFFLSQSENLFEQLRTFSVFDTKHLISAENALAAPKMKWNQFFRTPWANNVEHEKKYEILLDKAKELELDEKSGCLLQVVALFANDRADLKMKEQVERLQENFCILFLIDRDGEESASLKFPKYISMLSHLREMADIMRNQTLKL